MALETKEVETTVTMKTKSHYENLGYFVPTYVDSRGTMRIKKGTIIKVDAKHLNSGSNVGVLVKCDYCGCNIDTDYKTYIKNNKNGTQKDSCSKCKGHKIRATKGYKYSHEYVNELCEKMGFILISKEIKSVDDNLEVICKKHPNIIQRKRLYLLLKGKGCNICAREQNGLNKMYTYEYVKEAFEKRGYILISDKYEGIYKKLKYICPRHPDEELQISLGELHNGHGCKYCGIEKNSGKTHYLYNPDLTDEDRVERRAFKEYVQWQKEVYKKFHYTCQVCNQHIKQDGAAHHLYNYKDNPELRLEVDNGILMCGSCHREFHSIYTNKNNTPEQFEEYVLQKCQQKAV
jgi:hypothetical protein